MNISDLWKKWSNTSITLVLSFIFFFVEPVFGEPTIHVLVFPFRIYSEKQIQNLGTQVPEHIQRFLQEDGVVPVDLPSDISFESPLVIDEMRKIAIRVGADYIIWGSLTMPAEKFSLDAKILSVFDQKPARSAFIEGGNIENLPEVVKKISREFSLIMFKKQKVTNVVIKGNRRIESDAILHVVGTRKGDIFLPGKLTKDLKSIYAMGYFDDIRIESRDVTGGKEVIIFVTEKPTIRKIRLKNNRAVKDEDIFETLDIKTGSILNIFEINRNIKRIESIYKEKNYHNVRVTYSLKKLEHNQADLEFDIEEGEKIRIKEIRFSGNKTFTTEELKSKMDTTEKGFFSWITSSGELDRDKLNQDIAKLTAFYHNQGYVDARVSDPEVDFRGNWIFITVKIIEGSRYRVGKITIEGDLIQPVDKMMKKVYLRHEEFFNREILQRDVIRLTDLYTDEGYAYAAVSPGIDRNEETLTVDLKFRIKKGKLVYFDRIIIAGNMKTRDKVIRRELKVYEQELYSENGLKKSVRNLQRLDYFEDVKVNTFKGKSDDRMTLKIDVKEKSTGMFNFGGGYSSVDNMFFMATVSQRNLFGRGQTLQLQAYLGGSTDKYTLSFTEPWLFDIPLSAGFDIQNWEKDYDTYDKKTKGAGVRFGYKLFEYTRVYTSYSYDITDIRNIEEDASDSIWELEGINDTSKVSLSLVYDSRDRIFNPTEGSEHSVVFEYAGIGGDIGFSKYLLETGWYIGLFTEGMKEALLKKNIRGIPFVSDDVLFLHAKGGYVRRNTGGMLPDYERFYLGGMNSVRGFDWRDISTTDENGDEIGGNKFVQFNVELLIPLLKDAGVVGVLFYDTGNVFNNSESVDLAELRESVGFGFRWYSPMGPIRIENGYILNPKDDERKGGHWEFTIGTAF